MKLEPKYFASAKVLEPHLENTVLYSAPTSDFGDDMWSMAIEFLQKPKLGEFVPVVLDFLKDDAPYDKLESGKQVILREGDKKTTEVVVRGQFDHVSEGDLIDWIPEESIRVRVKSIKRG